MKTVWIQFIALDNDVRDEFVNLCSSVGVHLMALCAHEKAYLSVSLMT